jgi:hypothetical protein
MEDYELYRPRYLSRRDRHIAEAGPTPDTTRAAASA